MKKIVGLPALLALLSSLSQIDAASADDVAVAKSEAPADIVPGGAEGPPKEEFLELSEPHRNVSGAYLGVGAGVSLISNSIHCKRDGQPDIDFKNSASQFDLSLILGFGAPFSGRYYAGIELELFKRLSEKTSYHDTGLVGVRHVGNVGFNMDVRFGYLLPERSSLVYVTVGFAKVLGRAVFDNGDHQRKGDPTQAFGSYYPTLGVGAERKINQLWNVRGDLRFSVTSKDDNKNAYVRNFHWKFEGKPSRIALRVSIIRNI
ncbi:MAG: porin family protein [Holosporaceae bacterium]|jgi:hypothetical protein|nr:porin family protein [Holosporaceae bacterium]